MKLNDSQLKKIFPSLPHTKREVYLPLLVAAMEEFAITTRKRACAFLSQVGHESADLKYFEEIASGAAYEGRKDLGNTSPGDGRKYKGRGPIQITGKANYLRAGAKLGLDLLTHPELLSTPEHGFRAAALYWKTNSLNTYADALNLKADRKDLAVFDKITRVINGGYNGQLDRQRRYLDCIGALADEDFAVPSGPLPGDSPAIARNSSSIEGEKQAIGTNAGDSGTNDDFLNRFSGNERLQTMGRSAGQKLANRLGTPMSTLFAALEAGDRHAWLAVTIIAAGAGLFIYFERRAIARLATRIITLCKARL